MNDLFDLPAPPACDAAKRRLLSTRGDPFLFADWERVVFLHFVIAPDLLCLPDGIELELYDGKAVVSLVALTMRRFRPCRRVSLAWLLRPVVCQRFLNLRTYVRCQGEPGALFLHGWLSLPFRLRLPSGIFGLPYSFGSLDYQHGPEGGQISAVATEWPGGPRFVFRATSEPTAPCSQSLNSAGTGARGFALCAPGSLAEFAMERYTGFFIWRKTTRVFRVWHPPWVQMPIRATLEDTTLVTAKFPWFRKATLAEANFAPGFERVWLGRAHPLRSVVHADADAPR